MKWQVLLKEPKRIEKIINRLRPSTQVAFRRAVQDMQEQGPNPKGWIVGPLHGEMKGFMRLKIDYRHRMIYEVVENIMTITIVEVSTRERAY